MTINKLSIMAFKRKYDYEKDLMHCGNCKNFRKAQENLVNGIPVKLKHLCKLGKFYTKEYAICDAWKYKNE